MDYGFPFSSTDQVIELGGGNNPYFRPNLDVRSGENIDIVADFNEPLPIPDGQYDGVLSSYCIEHISWRKLKPFISEAYRILKNNGKVVFITANTERQMQHVLEQEVWNDDTSCIIFGDQDYPENTHRNSLCPRYAIDLMVAAGFTNVVVIPWGTLKTDMIIEAKKIVETRESDGEDFDGAKFYDENNDYYRDHPTNWCVFNKIMQLRPRSVLELGCGRGYTVKRLQSSGVLAHGIEISQHCILTRVTDAISHYDIRNTPWPFKDQEFDLVFSQGTLDNFEPDVNKKILSEAERVAKQGLHGINTNNLSWNNQNFVSTKDLTNGNLSLEIPTGDNKLKLNIGSSTSMIHNGWINADIIDLSEFAANNFYKFMQMDCTETLPFDDNTVDLVTSSHLLEHLSWDECLFFIQECYRILKPGAVVRIAAQDLQKLISIFQNSNLSKLDEISREAAQYKTQSSKLWSYLSEGHKMAYDWPSLKYIGEQSGFTVLLRAFNEGNETIIKESMDYLPEISIYIEMYK